MSSSGATAVRPSCRNNDDSIFHWIHPALYAHITIARLLIFQTMMIITTIAI